MHKDTVPQEETDAFRDAGAARSASEEVRLHSTGRGFSRRAHSERGPDSCVGSSESRRPLEEHLLMCLLTRLMCTLTRSMSFLIVRTSFQ
ncbi:uncharacterized protein SCHCODRAFT_01333749 [Schizophyllum commune H4-8]|uniref:uncharacterized protein n=1 Tax=Schizophyllum commune (strain H4-8 / FGSC 9210) TaxID=578458 RepID=UPI00215ED93C|nr:uncharacterized protein SCHCODRAFT_01333749 [Schizophyllum commune H4-8]KAI5888765.1 hypothetical protein SCHCODRAFT_01333749 [Schizophyllum commune H4-8]